MPGKYLLQHLLFPGLLGERAAAGLDPRPVTERVHDVSATLAVMARTFADRRDAGRRLARRLAEVDDVAHAEDVVVLGLPRGGVPVAAEVADALGAPLDILLVAKVGVPGHQELALGAVADDGTAVLNRQVLATARLEDAAVDALVDRAVERLADRGARLRPTGFVPVTDLAGRIVVVVDDGMATGATMRVALQVVRRRGAALVVAAVPGAPTEAAAVVAAEADRVVCVTTPREFFAVGPWYGDFTQVGDDEVRALLAASRR
jgi:putative phosphoribosyl transferase